MEVLAALGVGSLAWLAVYILLGKTHRRGALGSNQSTIMVLRYACRRLTECPGICRIAHLPSVALLRDELRRFSWIQRNSFSDDEIVGMILFGLMSIPVLFALICSSVIGIGIGLVVAIASCLVLVRMVERRKAQDLTREIPDVFRSLAVALGSGRTLSQAIEYVGTHEQGRIGSEFAKAALSLHCGASTSHALHQLETELNVPGIELLTTTLSISQRTGSPLRDLLLSSAELAEGNVELERSLRTKTAQARLSVRIVCIMPILMVLVLSTLSQEFRAGISTIPGMTCLAFSLLLDTVALFVVRHLMKGVMI